MEYNKNGLEHLKNLLGGWLDSLNESNMVLLGKMEELEKKVDRLESRIREIEENVLKETDIPLRGGAKAAMEKEAEETGDAGEPAGQPEKEMVPGIEWDSEPEGGVNPFAETGGRGPFLQGEEPAAEPGNGREQEYKEPEETVDKKRKEGTGAGINEKMKEKEFNSEPDRNGPAYRRNETEKDKGEEEKDLEDMPPRNMEMNHPDNGRRTEAAAGDDRIAYPAQEEEDAEKPKEGYGDAYEKKLKEKVQSVKKFFTGFRFKENFIGATEENENKEDENNKESETTGGIERQAGVEWREPAVNRGAGRYAGPELDGIYWKSGTVRLPEPPGTDYRTTVRGTAEDVWEGSRAESRECGITAGAADAESFPVEYVPEKESPKASSLPAWEAGAGPTPEPGLETVTGNETAGEETPKTVLDVVKPDWYDWEVDYPAPYIDDVFKGIALNDKPVFIRELFGGDEAAFRTALEKINTMENFKAVTAYMRERYPQWDEQSDEVYRFYMIVRRKFNR